MAWGLWIFVATLFAATWLLYWFDDGRGRSSALSYRHRYLKLIDQLESLVTLANALESKASASKEHKLVDSYAGNLRMLETLMEAIKGLPPFAVDVSMMQAPLFLVRDVTERFTSLNEEFEASASGKKVRPIRGFDSPHLGCYFCSRPFDPQFFHKVRVKIDNASHDVAACKICNRKLLAGKKAKVLFFSEEGQTVHWSKAKDYHPSATYWNINDDESQDAQVSRPGSHLTLVYSQVTPLSSQNRMDS
jgi:hypothetical protein